MALNSGEGKDDLDVTLSAGDDEVSSSLARVISTPINLFISLLSTAFGALRPFSSQLVPILVCAIFIPLLLFLSVSAGWVVWNNVAIGWEEPLSLQYGDGIPPYAQVNLPRLVPQQPYDISLHLEVPTTESNLALGNFMTSLALSTPTNKTLSSTRRSAIVLPPPTSYFLKAPRLVNLDVPLLVSFIPGTSRVNAHVEIGRRDGWTSLGSGEGREISLVSATLRGRVVRHGVRGLVTRFPLLFSFISAITFLVIVSLILGACILPTILQRSQGASHLLDDQKPEPRSPVVSPHSLSSSDGETPLRRRTPRGSKSRSRKQAQEVKIEAPITTMPSSTSGSSIPLRRRTSRLLDGDSDSD